MTELQQVKYAVKFESWACKDCDEYSSFNLHSEILTEGILSL